MLMKPRLLLVHNLGLLSNPSNKLDNNCKLILERWFNKCLYIHLLWGLSSDNVYPFTWGVDKIYHTQSSMNSHANLHYPGLNYI